MNHLVSLLAMLSLIPALAQTTVNPEFQSPRTASYYLAPVAGSGVTGSLQVNEILDGGTRLIVSLQNIVVGDSYALALFQNDCGPDRPLVEQLETVSNVPGDPYTSITDSSLTFDAITTEDYFLYVYSGTDMTTTLAACGEVGVGANSSSLPATNPAPPQPSQTPAPPTAEVTPPDAATAAQDSEFINPRTASYYLAPVNGSGVDANMQISEIIGGGTRIIVSLARSAQAGEHAVVLYEGDCGPDRPEVTRLSRIDNSDGDPYVSITNSALSFDTLTSGNHFAYLFQGEPGTALVACGEVGIGANR